MANSTPNSSGQLGACNYKIGHDDRLTQSDMMSMFKRDYPAHSHYGRGEIAKPPKLGDVIQKDERVSERASETVTSFQYRPMAKPVLQDVQNKLRVTNFKMDRDLDKVNVFSTTNNHYFQPKYKPQEKRTPADAGIQLSHIPNGDPDKMEGAITNYRAHFPGINPKEHPIIKAPTMHHGGDPTIKGDGRLSHYDTSHNYQFDGKWLAPPKTLPAPTGTNVPKGDPHKECTRETTMQSSFVDQSQGASYVPFDCVDVSHHLRKTNFNLHDGHGQWDDYRTIASMSYPFKADQLEISKPTKHRNASDFPEGDMDPARDVARRDATHYRDFMGNPARGLHNTIVSGANKRTKSNVWFGDPELGKDYYNTTTSNIFNPKSVPYTYNRTKFVKKSVIPLDYYNDNAGNTTTMGADYKEPKQRRMVLREDGLGQIRDSHILPPLNGQTFFNTTNNNEFTPKSVELDTYDRQRMQKSSVPLGTMVHGAVH